MNRSASGVKDFVLQWCQSKTRGYQVRIFNSFVDSRIPTAAELSSSFSFPTLSLGLKLRTFGTFQAGRNDVNQWPVPVSFESSSSKFRAPSRSCSCFPAV